MNAKYLFGGSYILIFIDFVMIRTLAWYVRNKYYVAGGNSLSRRVGDDLTDCTAS
jgi:hypothetical protein